MDATAQHIVETIYNDNLNHFEFMENMNNGDCDCYLHTTINNILKHWGDNNETI